MLESLEHVIRSRAVELRVVRAATVLWLLVRVMAAVAAVFASFDGMAIGNPVDTSVKASVIVVFVVVSLTLVDVRRQNVDLLLANLGTSRTATVLLPLAAASLLEIVIHMLWR